MVKMIITYPWTLYIQDILHKKKESAEYLPCDQDHISRNPCFKKIFEQILSL